MIDCYPLALGLNGFMIPIKPMLAVSGKAFSSKGWIFEPKIDGARCLAYVSNGTVELRNRKDEIDRISLS